MTQVELTLLFEAIAIGGTGWLATSFTLGLIAFWKRCDPAVAAARPALPKLSSEAKPKLGSEQPVDPDPDFDIEFEDAAALASFNNQFAL